MTTTKISRTNVSAGGISRRSALLVAAVGLFMASLAVPALALECEVGQRAFTHAGGETCIAEDPQRIVSLHDQSVTLTLLEVGAPVVGSHGRVDEQGARYMRSLDLLMGLDFESSGIGFAGSFEAMDFEAIAAMDPDLIIGRDYDLADQAKYETIAPTVFIAETSQDPFAFSRGVADAGGKLGEWEDMLAVYQANIERARFAFPPGIGATYAKIQGWDGILNVYAGYGGLTKVLQDLGFERVPFAQEMVKRGVAWGEEVSAEVLPELQADYIFDTYTIAYGDTLASPAERMAEVLPSWCDLLTACSEGRYIVVAREYATGFSFAQLNMLIQLIVTHAARLPAQPGA